MTRDEARRARAREAPIVGGLPDLPGIVAVMALTPALGHHLRGLADVLLVDDYPGATLSRAEREMLATAVSAANECFFCTDSHAAHAVALLERSGALELAPAVEAMAAGSFEGVSEKLRTLARIACTVAADARRLGADDVAAARAAGATDGDVQLAILIAAAFSMYNRLVDGFRARTPADTAVYRARAAEIATQGYAAPSALSRR
jgi:uncharacterized peroxidase-related enzyme